jgi:hypothetical protein
VDAERVGEITEQVITQRVAPVLDGFDAVRCRRCQVCELLDADRFGFTQAPECPADGANVRAGRVGGCRSRSTVPF